MGRWKQHLQAACPAFADLARGHAGGFFEEGGEIGGGAVAENFGDLRYFLIGIQ